MQRLAVLLKESVYKGIYGLRFTSPMEMAMNEASSIKVISRDIIALGILLGS